MQVADVADVTDVDDACDTWIWLPGASTTIPAIRQGRSARALWLPAIVSLGKGAYKPDYQQMVTGAIIKTD